MKLIKRMLNSKTFIFFKTLITLDGDKSFIVSSTTYYLLISLVPLSTISYYFLQLFGNFSVNSSSFFSIFITTSFSFDLLFSNNLNTAISNIISVYIASKGFLIYFYYINNKFNTKSFNFSFILNRIYIGLFTFIFA